MRHLCLLLLLLGLALAAPMLEQAPFGIAARSEAACLVSKGGDEPSRLYVFNKVLQKLG